MTTFMTSSSDANTQIPNLRILILITKIECCYLNLLDIYTRIYKQNQVRKKNKDSQIKDWAFDLMNKLIYQRVDTGTFDS